MKKLLISLCAIALAATSIAQPHMKWDEAYRKADAMIKTLSLDEKIEMTHGHNKFFLPGAAEKGLPRVFMVDASSGVRINYSIPDQNEVRHPLRTTQFPSTITIAATFNYYIKIQQTDIEEGTPSDANLLEQLNVSVTVDGSTKSGSEKLVDGLQIGAADDVIGMVKVGATATFTVTVEFLNLDTNNDAQGKQVAFDLIVYAVQAVA